MKKLNLKLIFVIKLVILLSLFLCACGGSQESENPEDAALNPASTTESEDVSQQSGFEEGELPEDFPSDFPIPPDARVGSSINPSRGGFQVYLSLQGTLEEALNYYREELPAAGWMITSDKENLGNPYLKISGEEYQGELMFVSAGTGVGLDVTLLPPDDAQENPDIPENMGEGTTLGGGESGFPDDFPLPVSFQPVGLSTTLEEQGYQLAFSYQDLPELALADLTMALINGAWTVGDPSLEGTQRAYRLPFENPATGFQGHALISNDPSVIGADYQEMTIIAFLAGE